MPERPTPRELPDIINKILARLGKVERHRHPLDEWFFRQGDCVSVSGKGSEYDPFFISPLLNPDPTNQLECTEDGLFVSAGQHVGWDAVVDGTIVASDPVARLFKGIGEACAYLDGLGLEAVNIFVRNNHTGYSSSSLEPYVETANWNSPASVHLFAKRGGNDANEIGVVQEQTGVSWQTGAFRPISSSTPAFSPPDYFIHGFASLNLGTWTTPKFRQLILNETHVVSSGSATGALCSNLNAYHSSFDLLASRTLSSGPCLMVQCDVGLGSISGAAATYILGTLDLFMVGCRMQDTGSGGTRTLTLPITFDIEFASATQFKWRVARSLGSSLNITVPVNAQGRIRCSDHAATGAFNLTSSSSTEELDIEGDFNNITISGTCRRLQIDVTCDALTVTGPTVSENPHYIRALTAGAVDITGPANVSLMVQGGTDTVTLRGAITGQIIGRGVTLSSGAFINGIAMGASSLNIVAGGNAASGTARPYILDAASTHNFIMWPNLGSWANAGTDSGSNNRIETTPGTVLAHVHDHGVLTGLTDDDHPQYIKDSEFDAKGDLLVGTANDTFDNLPKGTDGQVLTANDAEPTGLEWADPTTGVTDHGALTGLADDDHALYLKEKASGGTAAEVPEHTHADATEAGSVSHDDLADVSSDDHHAKLHGHDGADGSGTVAHADTTGQTADDHHAEDHAARHAEGAADELDVADLGSGAADAGDVATADGAGGVDWTAPVTGVTDHGALTGLADDDHDQYLKDKANGGLAAEVPTHTHADAANAGTVSHDILTDVSADDHHAKIHGHDGADGSGTVAHADTTGQTTDDHHDQLHAHDGVDGSGTVSHDDLTDVSIDDHHARDHAASHAENGADEIDAGTLGSGASSDGHVLTSDGAGGAAWEPVPGGHTEDHDHDGSPTQKLVQANTHESADTDSAPTALHHTLGTGANQAAAGDHGHTGISAPLFARKTADETVTSSTTLQDDNHLSVSVQTGFYVMELVVMYNGAQGGDLKLAFGGTSTFDGKAGALTALHENATGMNETRVMLATPTVSHVIGCITGSDVAATWLALMEVTAAGTFLLRWAQGSSHATATRIYSGSYMKLDKVA